MLEQLTGRHRFGGRERAQRPRGDKRVCCPARPQSAATRSTNSGGNVRVDSPTAMRSGNRSSVSGLT